MLQQIHCEHVDPKTTVTSRITCCVRWKRRMEPGWKVTFKGEPETEWTVLSAYILPVAEVEKSWHVGGL